MMIKRKQKRRYWNFLPLFFIILLGVACQKIPTPADTIVVHSTVSPVAIKTPIPSDTVENQSTPESHQRFDSIDWEWILPGGCSFVSISPENIWVIYYCEQGTQSEVWIENIFEDSSPILLLEDSPWPLTAWSPNGKMMTITSSREDIWLYHIGDWGKKQLLYTSSDYLGRDEIPLPHKNPVWSSNNEYLALLNYSGFEKPLVLLQPDGTEIPLLYSNDFYDPASTNLDNPRADLPLVLDAGPTWSPDSRKIAFLVVTDIDLVYSRALWIWDLELNDYSVAFELDQDPLHEPTWSSDGRVIAFLGSREIVFYNLDEETIKRIEFDQNFSDLRSILWSPDSKRMIVDIGLAINEQESKEWSNMTSDQKELIMSNIWGSWILDIEDEEWQMLDFFHQHSRIIKWIGKGDELRFVVKCKEENQEIIKSVLLQVKQ